MFDWGRIWLIAQRELKTRFKQRSYRITTIVQIVIIALIALAPVLIAKFGPDDTGSASASTVAIVDEAETGLPSMMPQYLDVMAGGGEPIEVVTADSVDGARQMVDSGEADSAVVTGRADDGSIALTYINEDGDASSADSQRILAAASSVVLEERIASSGLSGDEVQQVFMAPAISVTETGEAGDGDSDSFDAVAYVISFLATILIFLAVVLYGQWIATGVVEEKSSRIMEIMVNAATPRDLLAGKVIGIMLAALCQFAPMLLVGGLIFAFQPQIADLMGVDVTEVLDVDFGLISAKAVGWFLVYFLLGFLLYGSLYAGVGSLVSRQEEVSTAIAPMSMIMFLGYFAALTSLSDPDTTIARVAFLFPLTSPFVAVARMMLVDPPIGEIALSLGLLIAAVLGAMWLAGRLYRVGVLMYGQAPGFKSLLRLRGMQGVAR